MSRSSLNPTIVPAQSAASTDTVASAALNPKAPGTVRIGIVLPANQLSGKGQLQDGEPLRTAELQLLRGPRLEAVPLQSILPDQAQQEGKLQGCDFVLTTTVAQQPAEKSDRFRRFTGRDMLHMATSAAQFMPVVGASSMVANLVMTSALSQATTLALTNAAQPVRADSDVTLTYKLTKTDGTMVLSTDEKAHTSSNGENILTPMLTSMSAKVAGAAKL